MQTVIIVMYVDRYYLNKNTYHNDPTIGQVIVLKSINLLIG